METMRSFALPKELNPRSHLKAILGCLYAYGMFFGSWAIMTWIFSVGSLAAWVFALPVLVIGGYGMLNMGFMGHDGTHFSLHENKVVSCVIGIIVTAPVFPYLVMGFTISHWNHHKFTNSEQDPDSVLFAKFRNLFTRAFIARPYTFMEYGLNTVRLALKRPLPFSYQFPLSNDLLQKLAIFNIFASLFFGALYAAICLASVNAALALGVVYLFGTAISGLSPYVEHTATGVGRGLDTRTAEGWWWDVLILGNNYHIEHHLYPSVPFYNLKGIYQYLKASGFYTSNKHLSKGMWGTYKYALAKYPYPLNRPTK